MITESIATARDANGRGAARLSDLAIIGAQLLLIVLVLRELDMLAPAYRRIVSLAAVGFFVHHFLPLRLRLRAFVLLSIGAIFLVLGMPTEPGSFWNASAAIPRAGLVLAVGVVLIGICRLRIGFWWRAGLLGLTAIGVAIFRAGMFPSLGLDVVWIVLAATFMFRIIVFLYDVSTSKEPRLWSESLAYFFLIPNVCCTLFPVIDFKTFCRSHYNDAALTIYQRGVRWMARGIVQLLIYRYVEQIFSLPVTWVHNGLDLVRFLVTNSLLYLNVSGQFHFIAGLLLLFGFSLPATNNNYFLASSFTDYWRRVNIYWKDFMLKVFYYPAFFRLKRFGGTLALVLATAWVFLITWALHLYQTWWLKGSATITWPDTLFWLTLGLLILANSLWEMKRGRRRTLSASTASWSEEAWLVVRTGATFACICVLWSLWSSPSLQVWLGIWQYADRYTLLGGVLVLMTVMAAKLVLEILPARRRAIPTPSSVSAMWQREVILASGPLLVLYLAAYLAINSLLPSMGLERIDRRLRPERFYDVLEAGDSLIPEQYAEELNYYKNLTSLDESNRQYLEILLGRRIPMSPPDKNPPVIATADLRSQVLKPFIRGQAYETDDFRTNRWGMRDRDYEMAKPAGTVRIALLGSSHTMGYAVRQEEVFENILERRLDQDVASGVKHPHIEILNFAAPGFSPLSQIDVLRRQAIGFKPDFVLLVAHLQDLNTVNYHLRAMVKSERPISENFLLRTLLEARVTPSTFSGLVEKRLRPYESAVVRWSLHRIAEESRSIGAVPLYFLFPAPGWELPLTPARAAGAEALNTLAAEEGFIVLDGSRIFDAEEDADLWTGISPHSNPKAHSIIADALYKDLLSDRRIALAGGGRSACVRESNVSCQ